MECEEDELSEAQVWNSNFFLSTVFFYCENCEQVAYYARKQGEFRDVMSRLEEMARLGAKVQLKYRSWRFYSEILP